MRGRWLCKSSCQELTQNIRLQGTELAAAVAILWREQPALGSRLAGAGCRPHHLHRRQQHRGAPGRLHLPGRDRRAQLQTAAGWQAHVGRCSAVRGEVRGSADAKQVPTQGHPMTTLACRAQQQGHTVRSTMRRLEAVRWSPGSARVGVAARSDATISLYDPQRGLVRAVHSAAAAAARAGRADHPTSCRQLLASSRLSAAQATAPPALPASTIWPSAAPIPAGWWLQASAARQASCFAFDVQDMALQLISSCAQAFVWDTRASALPRARLSGAGPIDVLQLTPDGHALLAGTVRGQVRRLLQALCWLYSAAERPGGAPCMRQRPCLTLAA